MLNKKKQLPMKKNENVTKPMYGMKSMFFNKLLPNYL